MGALSGRGGMRSVSGILMIGRGGRLRLGGGRVFERHPRRLCKPNRGGMGLGQRFFRDERYSTPVLVNCLPFV